MPFRRSRRRGTGLTHEHRIVTRMLPPIMIRVSPRPKPECDAMTIGRDIVWPFAVAADIPRTVCISPYSLDVFDVIWVDRVMQKYVKSVFVYTNKQWTNAKDDRMCALNFDTVSLDAQWCLKGQIVRHSDLCPHWGPIDEGSTIVGKLQTAHGESHTFMVTGDGESWQCIMHANHTRSWPPVMRVEKTPVNLCQFIYCPHRKCIVAMQRVGDRMNLWQYYVECGSVKGNQWRCVFRMTQTWRKDFILGAVLGSRYIIMIGSAGLNREEDSDGQLRVFDLDTRLFLSYFSWVLHHARVNNLDAMNVIHRSEYRIRLFLEGLSKHYKVKVPIPIMVLLLIQKWWGMKGELCVFDKGWNKGKARFKVTETDLYDEIRQTDWSMSIESE